MKQESELKFYEKAKNWNFDEFEIVSEKLTDWSLFEIINKLATKESRILDLGTGGGEKVIAYYPDCKEILGTDFSPGMIETANYNLVKSGRQNIRFILMDNLKMDVPDNYFDIVVARNTITDPKQIYKCLKKNGYLIIRGVDGDDCYNLKYLFNGRDTYGNQKPISIIDYENVIEAGFKDAELVPIYEREYFKNKELFVKFLKKVPIINGFNNESVYDEKKIDLYIKENTYDGKIRLLRRYYGITARK